jgi:flavin reductase (DIM6/NTAB) family NADH-FMN oxidoreductase RutF
MQDTTSWVPLDTDHPVWDLFYTVAPLYVVGTSSPDGAPDLAPKHLAMPMSWDNFFGFVCAETHTTYKNIKSEGVFTVSAPRPDNVVLTSLAASPRCEDGSKPVVQALPTAPGQVVDAPYLRDAYLVLECQLSRMVEELGRNVLIIGEVVAARVHPDFHTDCERDAQEQLYDHPLLAYVSPGRFSSIKKTLAFPFPRGFHK